MPQHAYWTSPHSYWRPTHTPTCAPTAAVFTGAVELLATEVLVLNTVNKPLPFPISNAEEKEAAREEVRLRNRVLDLRCALLRFRSCKQALNAPLC